MHSDHSSLTLLHLITGPAALVYGSQNIQNLYSFIFAYLLLSHTRALKDRACVSESECQILRPRDPDTTDEELKARVMYSCLQLEFGNFLVSRLAEPKKCRYARASVVDGAGRNSGRDEEGDDGRSRRGI